MKKQFVPGSNLRRSPAGRPNPGSLLFQQQLFTFHVFCQRRNESEVGTVLGVFQTRAQWRPAIIDFGPIARVIETESFGNWGHFWELVLVVPKAPWAGSPSVWAGV